MDPEAPTVLVTVESTRISGQGQAHQQHSIAPKRNNLLRGPSGGNEERAKREEHRQLKKVPRTKTSPPTRLPFLQVAVTVQGESRFTRQQIESGSAPLAVLVALEVVLIIVVILGVPVPVHVADVSRGTVAGRTPLSGLSHAGPMIVTKEDGRRRRRRQLRALKATLKIPGQERLYRVSLRRAWKTERETRSRDQSTTSSRSYRIPITVLARVVRIPVLALSPPVSLHLRLLFGYLSLHHRFSPSFSLSFFCSLFAACFPSSKKPDDRVLLLVKRIARA